ncbi:unnamed protein product, partial [Lepidochelys kempii]
MAGRGKLIAVMGDEDTVTGFLLGGVGELNKHRKPNFLVVEKDTSLTEIEETFRSFLSREDIGIILINQFIAELIRHVLDAHTPLAARRAGDPPPRSTPTTPPRTPSCAAPGACSPPRTCA